MGAGGPELPLAHAARRAEAAAHPRRRRGGPGAARVSRTPGGHPEGYLEGFANIYAEAARAIRAKREASRCRRRCVFPTVEDGVAGVAFVDACVRSSARNAAWVTL